MEYAPFSFAVYDYDHMIDAKYWIPARPNGFEVATTTD